MCIITFMSIPDPTPEALYDAAFDTAEAITLGILAALGKIIFVLIAGCAINDYIKKVISNDNIKSKRNEDIRKNTARFTQNKDEKTFINEFDSLDFSKPIILEINSYGGSADKYTAIVGHIIYRKTVHRFKLTGVVNDFACSGAALICLACDELVMTANAYLTPFDPFLNTDPSESLPYTFDEKLFDKKGKDSLKDFLWQEEFKYSKEKIIALLEATLKKIADTHGWTTERYKMINDIFLSGKIYLHNKRFYSYDLVLFDFNVIQI